MCRSVLFSSSNGQNFCLLSFGKELYESTEYSAVTINETWSQQLIRISQAIGFSAAQMGTQLFGTLGMEETKGATEIEIEIEIENDLKTK